MNVGRVVLYGEMVTSQQIEPVARAAIVTHVNIDRTVTLRVLHPAGTLFDSDVKNVRFSDKLRFHHWTPCL